MRKGFTLIELLIVVAIIAILAAIAVPNFLEAQTRAKVTRVKSDLRSIATGVETFRVDHNKHPEGTDDPLKYDEKVVEFLTPYGLQKGYYGFRTRGGGIVGQDFPGITTPISYISNVPTDIFTREASAVWTYCYRNAKTKNNGYILTSVGPDGDQLGINNSGRGNTNTANPISTAVDPGTTPRLGDINERMVIHLYEGDAPAPVVATDYGKMREHLEDLTYDPTNGSISDGDIYRIP